jgi:uncharacterized membrane protein
LEVPKSFADLIGTMRGFPAFAVSFAMLATIWNTHYKFSRRYGLHDATTRFLTCVLLFIVLFYVSPLKLLFTLSINDMIFGHSIDAPAVSKSELSTLFSVYSFGFAAIYFAFSLLTSTHGGCAALLNYRRSKTRNPLHQFSSACGGQSSD